MCVYRCQRQTGIWTPSPSLFFLGFLLAQQGGTQPVLLPRDIAKYRDRHTETEGEYVRAAMSI